MTIRSCNTKFKCEATQFLEKFKFENTSKPQINKSFLKLSDVREKIISHYKMNNSYNTYLSYRNSYDNIVRIIKVKSISSIDKSDFENFKLIRSKEINSV